MSKAERVWHAVMETLIGVLILAVLLLLLAGSIAVLTALTVGTVQLVPQIPAGLRLAC